MEMWENTAYAGMEFTTESEWKDLRAMQDAGYPYSSPVYKFENDDRVATGKQGEIIVL